MTTMDTTPNKPYFNWEAWWVIIGTPLIILAVAPYGLYQLGAGWQALFAGLFWHAMLNAGIGVGYHRSWTHGAAKLHPAVEWVLLYFGAAALQGPAAVWISKHKDHHTFAEKPKDPHNIQKGFWWAHWLWMLHDPMTDARKAIGLIRRNPSFLFQLQHYRKIAYGMNTVGALMVALAFGWGGGWQQIICCFLAIQIARVVQQQGTFCVNSVCHKFGTRLYSLKQHATDNWFVRLLTGGEGGHNFHHAFAGDYRNSWRWYQYDPHKWIIWVLVKLGLARFTANAVTPESKIRGAMENVKLELDQQAT